MDDPFFAEDDGEFDDFYGNGARNSRPSQSSVPRPSETRKSAVRAAPSLAYPDTPASSVASFMSKSTDGGPLTTTSRRNSTERAHKKSKKPRRRRSQERFDVEWENDADVSACFVCGNDFSLIKRKHHCRHCGRVICSDCSSYWRFPTSHGKHRVCTYCNVELATGTGRQTVGGRMSVSDAESVTPQHHDSGDRRGGKLRQSIVGAFSSNAADKRHRGHDDNTPSGSMVTPAQRMTHARNREAHDSAGELFDTSDDGWFGDPVDDGQDKRRPKHREQPKSHDRDSYSRPKVIREPDSLFAVQFTSENQSDDASEGEKDDFSMPKPPGEVNSSVAPRRSPEKRDSTRSSSTGRRDDPMTLDELHQSSVSASYASAADSYETALVIVPTLKTGTSDRPTFYDADADQLVIDEEPGYYDSAMHERRKLRTSTPGYSNHATMPHPSILAGGSEGSSGTLVEAPDMNTSGAAPVASKGKEASPEGKGIAGALKRFFGMSKNKREGASKKHSETDAAPVRAVSVVPKTPPPVTSDRPSVVSTNEDPSPIPMSMPRPTVKATSSETFHHVAFDDHKSIRDEEAVDARYTIADADRFRGESHLSVVGAPLRHTMAGYSVPAPRAGADNLMRASVVGSTQFAGTEPTSQLIPEKREKRRSTRDRRDTFDDLFDSPTKKASAPPLLTSNLPRRSWEPPTFDGRATVGVDRFDRPRHEEADIDLTHDAAMPADDEFRVSKLRASTSRTPWNTVSSHRTAAETPTFAIPGAYDIRAEPSSYDQPHVTQEPALSVDVQYQHDTTSHYDDDRYEEPRRTIMDDLKPKLSAPSSRPSSRQDTLDDFFADFEKPTDYIFDSVSGTYVPANPRHSAHNFADSRNVAPSYVSHSDLHQEQAATQSWQERSREPAHHSQQERYGTALEPVNEEATDEIDGIIADKISTLAGELESLKQLLRTRRVQRSPRNGSGPTSADRKQSIFDSDGSDEDVKPTAKTVTATAKRRSSSRRVNGGKVTSQKSRQKRKDSFADLFEDDTVEAKTRGPLGARNYEALFEIGKDTPIGGGGDSDGDRGEQKLSSLRKKRGSQHVGLQMSDSESSSDEYEGVKSKSSSRFESVDRRRSKPEPAGEADLDVLVPVSSSSVTSGESVAAKKAKRKDAIDSLFDSDSDEGVDALYETTSAAGAGSKPTNEEEKPRSWSDDDEAPGNSRIGTTGQEYGQRRRSRGQQRVPEVSGSEKFGSVAANNVSSDEEFSSTLKNLRRRTNTSQPPKRSPPRSPLSSDDEELVPALDRAPGSQLHLLVTQDRSNEMISSTSDDENDTSLPHQPVDVKIADPNDASPSSHSPAISGESVLSVVLHDESVTENGMSNPEQSPTASHVDVSSAFLSPAVPEFDPLALLDEEPEEQKLERRTPSEDATTSPCEEKVSLSVGQPWEEEAVQVASRLKALRFRDDLFGDATDVLPNSPSLDLDDLIGGPLAASDDDDGDRNDGFGGDDDFSFEIKPTKLGASKPSSASVAPVPPAVPAQVTRGVEEDDVEADEGAIVGGQSSGVMGAQDKDSVALPVLASVKEEVTWGTVSVASSNGDAELGLELDSAHFQDDWQRMQEQEKERKKKLQLKQRQAQREKLKKQASSGRSLGKTTNSRGLGGTAASPTAASSKQGSRADDSHESSEKKKKKKKHSKRPDDGDADEARTHRKSEKRKQNRESVADQAGAGGESQHGEVEGSAVPPSSFTEL